MRLTDLARVIAPECRQEIVGIRPGEKLHEVMIPVDDGRQTVEFKNHFIIKPSFPWWSDKWHTEKSGKPCPDGFYYGSDNNTDWVKDEQLAQMIAGLDSPEAKEWATEHGVEVGPQTTDHRPQI
jgi:UDP-N-acetylglucosamine 4,6-dehydratase